MKQKLQAHTVTAVATIRKTFRATNAKDAKKRMDAWIETEVISEIDNPRQLFTYTVNTGTALADKKSAMPDITVPVLEWAVEHKILKYSSVNNKLKQVKDLNNTMSEDDKRLLFKSYHSSVFMQRFCDNSDLDKCRELCTELYMALEALQMSVTWNEYTEPIHKQCTTATTAYIKFQTALAAKGF